MNFLDQHFGTNYEDFKGRLSIDLHDGTNRLFQLCKQRGIDVEQYFPIGFQVYEEEILGMGDLESITLVVWSLDTATYGNTFDNISAYLQANKGAARVQTHHIEISLSDFGKLIKRLSIIAVSDISEHIKELTIED